MNHAQPLNAREQVNENNRRNTNRLLFLAIGYLLTIIVGCVQLYYLTQMITGLNDSGDLDHWQVVAFALFFFLFSLLFLVRYILTMLFSFMEAVKEPSKYQLDAVGDALVTILIPAWNEETNISDTIYSAMNVDYPNIEIIAINDGSTDDTLRIMCEVAAESPGIITILDKPNGGKSSALNLGYAKARGEYIMCMDADSELAKDAIARLMARIARTDLGGAAGQVAIRNSNSVLTYLQSLEYIVMNGTARLFQSFFSTVLVAPGPITLFKRSALETVINTRGLVGDTMSNNQGPWEDDTFAEDAKLSMAMLASGTGLVFVPSAVCYTQCPDSSKALMNQRYRWVRGNLQAARSAWTLWTHVSDKRPNLGLWLGWLFIESILWPIIDITALILVLYTLTASVGPSMTAITWYLFLLGADICAAGFAATTCRQPLSIVFFVPIYRLFYSIFLEIGALFSMFDEARNARMKW